MLDTVSQASEGPVAIVAHTHPSVTKGGGEIAAYALFDGLRKLGVPAIFVAACPSADRNRVMLGSDAEYIVTADPQRYDPFYHLSSADVWRQLRRILIDRQVSFVHFHHFLNFGVNTLRALHAETTLPFAVTFHEFVAICNHNGQMVTRPARRLCPQATPTACASCYPEQSRQQFALRRDLIAGALEAAAGFVAPSRFVADRLIAWGLQGEKFTVIENGLRHPDARSPRTRMPGEPWTFGYFGQITPYKGCDVLLDALDILARDPDIGSKIRVRVHGNLIGQTPEFTARFEAAFAQHRFATYTGPYDNEDVSVLMHGCDYVVVPSTWWENSPVVIQEAYAAGRPVICSGIGGMAEKVPDGVAGLHVRVSDPGDLARTLLRACDSALHQTLSAGLPEASDTLTMANAYRSAWTAMFAAAVPDDTSLLRQAAAEVVEEQNEPVVSAATLRHAETF